MTAIVKHQQHGLADHITGLPHDIFPGNYSDKERGMIMAICERYGFDPLLKEVELLHGQIFVTAKGIARVATSDPTFNGVEVEIIHQDWTKGKEFFVIKARVWKKGCDHPVEDLADSDGSKMKGGNLFRHTITRAKARAMRSAFAIPFCSKEELTDEDQVQVTAESAPEPSQIPETTNTNTAHAMKRIHAVGNERGISHEEIRAITGAESLTELSVADLNSWANTIAELTQHDADKCKAMMKAHTFSELRSVWDSTSQKGRAILANAKDAAKARISLYMTEVPRQETTA